MKKTNSVISACPLFRGLDEEALARALTLFEAYEKTYPRDALLKKPGDGLASFGLVLAGTVQVYEYDIEGAPMMMANVTAGRSFGESLSYLKQSSPISIVAATDCRVLWLNPAVLLRDTADAFTLMLGRRFTSMLAARTLEMNRRIQILSKLTLREKLIAFFSVYAPADRTVFTVPFRRHEMAVYLGTNRSALSRELSRMKSEGLLDYDGSSFKLFLSVKE